MSATERYETNKARREALNRANLKAVLRLFMVVFIPEYKIN